MAQLKMAKNHKMAVFAILGVPKMALRVPESKFRDHFSIRTSLQNPQKATSGIKIGPRKVIFGNFFNSAYFYVVFPLARAFFSIAFLQRKEASKQKM